jgi:hypothetical protein
LDAAGLGLNPLTPSLCGLNSTTIYITRKCNCSVIVKKWTHSWLFWRISELFCTNYVLTQSFDKGIERSEWNCFLTLSGIVM